MKSTTTSGRLFRACLLLALGTALTFGCCACAGGTIYRNDNSARGKEEVNLPGMSWPWPMNKQDGCCAPK